MIEQLNGKYRFLSNFWSCYIEYAGLEFPSVENAYQAAKCLFREDMWKFAGIKSSEAKQLGKIIRIREDWKEIKTGIMHSLVLQKFTRHKDLRLRLLQTMDEDIQEGNWWGDTFWGTVNGKGENHLGKILMEVRDELRRGQSGTGE